MDAAPPETDTLSLHDALPISFGQDLEKDTTAVVVKSGGKVLGSVRHPLNTSDFSSFLLQAQASDRKSTRLNSSHVRTSYAVFCLKKKRCDTHMHAIQPACPAQ